MDGNDERERRGKLHLLAQLLVTPVETPQLLSQIPSACLLQAILQQLGLVRLVP